MIRKDLNTAVSALLRNEPNAALMGRLPFHVVDRILEAAGKERPNDKLWDCLLAVTIFKEKDEDDSQIKTRALKLNILPRVHCEHLNMMRHEAIPVSHALDSKQAEKPRPEHPQLTSARATGLLFGYLDVVEWWYVDCPINPNRLSSIYFSPYRNYANVLAICGSSRSGSYRSVCDAVGFLGVEACEMLTPTERWHELLRWCDEEKSAEAIRALLEKMPREPAPELRRLQSLGTTDALRWHNLDEIQEEVFKLLPPEVQPVAGYTTPQAETAVQWFGLLGMIETGSAIDPHWTCLIEAKEQLREISKQATVLGLREYTGRVGVVNALGQVADPLLAMEFAAFWLGRKWDKSPDVMEITIRWILDQLDSLPVRASTLLELLFRLYPQTVSIAGSWIKEMIEKSPEALLPGEQRAVLIRLNNCELAALNARVRLWQENEDPPSIEWAIRTKQTSKLADLLERLGETRLGIYWQLFQQTNDVHARRSLARSIRRLAESDAEALEVLGEPALQLAIASARPNAPQSVLDRLSADPTTLRWWLEVLPSSLSVPQLDRLIQLYQDQSAAAVQRQLSDSVLKVLTGLPDLLAVWRRLGPQRRRWVQEIPDRCLVWGNFRALLNALQGSTPDRSEREDLQLLTKRFNAAQLQAKAGPEAPEGYRAYA